jgi:hypothetical protein
MSGEPTRSLAIAGTGLRIRAGGYVVHHIQDPHPSYGSDPAPLRPTEQDYQSLVQAMHDTENGFVPARPQLARFRHLGWWYQGAWTQRAEDTRRSCHAP